MAEGGTARLYLIRHPAPLGAAGVCYGRTDLPPDPDDLTRTAADLRGRWSVGPVFSSPASRCLALARLLAEPAVPIVLPELHEIDFGCWEGLRWDAIPRAELDAWAADLVAYRPGGGESASDVAGRWRQAVAKIRQHAAGRPARIVTHAGLIRAALTVELGLEWPEALSTNLVFGSVIAIPAPPGLE